jgi:hypothetical protein
MRHHLWSFDSDGGGILRGRSRDPTCVGLLSESQALQTHITDHLDVVSLAQHFNEAGQEHYGDAA